MKINAAFKNGVYFGAGFLSIFSLAYAAISWPSPPAGEVSGGKYTTRLVPSGAIQAFNLSTCPVGWKVADGSNSTPDLRGEFIRGLDLGRNVDIGRTLASSQISTQIAVDFNKDSTIGAMDQTANNLATLGYESSQLATNAAFSIVWLGSPMVDNVGTSSSTQFFSRSLRPRNVAFLYCIKD